jgi:hypothetical protein
MQRRSTWVTLFSITILVPVLYQAQVVPDAPVDALHHRCSVASLKGTYAFRRTGVNNAVGPIAEIGIDVFNGDGTRGIIRITRSANGEIQNWTERPSGSYKVHADCTGALFNADGIKNHNLVVLDGGKRFLLLSILPGTTITAEAERLP